MAKERIVHVKRKLERESSD